MLERHASTLIGDSSVEPVRRYRWVVLLVGWSVLFLSVVNRLIWANVATAATGAFHLPIAALGSFVTAFYVGYVVANAINGVATDRFGVRFILPGSVLFLGIFTYLFGEVRTVAAGMVVQCLLGLAAGVDFATGIKIVSAWFTPQYRGRAIGVVITGLPAGIVAANTLIPALLPHFSWDSIYRIFGSATIVVSLICFLVVRDAPRTASAPVSRSSLRDVVPFLSNRNFWIVCFAGFGGVWALTGFMFWTNALMQKHLGYTAVQSGVVAAVYGAVAIVGPPVLGACSDWLGRPRKWLAAVVFIAITLCLVVFGGLTELRTMAIVAGVLGFCSVGCFTLVVTMLTELVEVDLAASAVGLNNAFAQLAGVIMPVAVGIVFRETSSFFLAFLTLAAGPLVSVILVMTLREGLIQRGS
ncbi:MFS transporter [Paraburkholderia ferrariae]|uniref:MFS transporter n=1 Tax=Paraburkholderia ferrariae TaxID=386056 RepID=UPI0006948576|nr:MFS transporter [Paraburkholderia ferrariae]